MCNKILNHPQALALREAMYALNNVGGVLCCNIDGIVGVVETCDGQIVVRRQVNPVSSLEMLSETYANQQAFLAAYGVE